MPAKVISKVLEIENCNKEELIVALYKAKFWEIISPVKKVEAQFSAPNVLHTIIEDRIDVVNIPINMEGELVLIDKGEEGGKGRLIEFNVRNNKDFKKLEGNLRIKGISDNQSKVGIFVHTFILESAFLNLIGKSTSEMVLRLKLTELMRKLEKHCKTNSLKDIN